MIVPDAIEPIVAWRYWSLNDDGQLGSPFFDDRWVPGERKEARCCDMLSMFRAFADAETIAHLETITEPEHPAPHEDCMCGIHAAKDLPTLRILGSGPIVGEVYLWGKIIPGENGYRAQYAYPKSLYVVSKRVLGDELEPLRAYCEDVGVMAPREAWGFWLRRALRFVDLLWARACSRPS